MAVRDYLKRSILRVAALLVPKEKVVADVSELSASDMLRGRCALITGGTSGIGYEMAKAFVKAGATVVVTGRNRERVNEACRKLESEVGTEGAVYGMAWDNTKVKEMPDRFREALALAGDRKIDILVNNAGLVGGEISDCTEEDFDAIVDTNLKGTFFLSQLVARYFINNKIKGNILNIGSSSSLRPATSAYTMTKWAVYGLTRGLAKILAPHGITVNGLAPGPTATPMLMPGGIKDDIAFGNSLGRYELPCEIANMAVFLVSGMGRAVIGDMVFMTGGSGVVTYDDVHYSF
ncbi:SDR family oxidoreductase [Bacteroides acidifaciens]|uniref:SDR family NAD(P)-dependent oxidoreductase n=1 Tax=Bacteroides acidifaciens TaxID=85831 RepID=UPI003013E03C